ncbi:MAG: hypothetical protein Q7S58_12400 [Candidatus Binatus sp.]|uniref:hypothetical protein n=1 Tax=Candidatus Binatus sp. TaxID=2811406 RepID=UPI00271FFECB|nr:hypothetical protein [Candidatus Binatus sp.]MDO8433200.1 hypothetical protein [Candidatus Binatus sp.]
MSELLSAAEEVPVSLNRETIRKVISSKVTSATSEELDKLIHVLLTLNATRGHFDAPVPEFVDDVLDAMAQSGRKELVVSADKEKEVRDRLTRLLSFDSLRTASKAMHLRTDHERVFYYARVLTDARPVYGADPSSTPSAFVISHTLKLNFSKDDGFGEFFIALDKDDVEYLKDVLDRAQQKEESLKKTFEMVNIPVVES